MFRWKLPCNSHIGPKPVVATGSGAGYAIALSGMPPSTTLLYAGQFIAVPLPSGHVRAVCLVTDLVTDSSGNATVTFRPALGEIPTLGATVETADPYIPVSMTESEQGFSLSDGISATSFDVEEAR